MSDRRAANQRASAASLAQNRAFVFVKPHALTESVKDFVRDALTTRGAAVVSEGRIDAAAIDRDMLVDKHYYAIASKATLLKPDKLPVPAEKFKEKFGVDWHEALRSGSALNARDACERFRVDAAGLGALWNGAKASGKFVKFGGGFYCGEIETPEAGRFFVFNGFFMEMRNKYVAPGAAIYYFLVDWSPLDTAWADFRGKVLGPTDPSQAPADSIRGVIYSRWQEFGLPDKPNIADNGVHASASPMEALFERMNWLGVTMQNDPFGARLLENHISPELVEEWRRDPQVTLGKAEARVKVSLYDALEDLDVDRCILKCKDIAQTGRTHATVHKNRAFVFIKPHAQQPSVKNLLKDVFHERCIRVVQEGVIDAEQIDEDMLIDKHYYAIASKATLLTPDKLPVPQDKFKANFGVEWQDVLHEGMALNAKDACEVFSMSPDELGVAWNEARAAGNLVKLSGGFYCAKMEYQGNPYFVFNGFFMDMRGKFVKQGVELHYFVVDWDPVQLSWKDFRGSVLGPTDPAKAEPTSIRGRLYAEWEALGLAFQPNMGDNGVHASASPIEALFERMNWLGVRVDRDPFGKLLLEGKVSPEQVDDWSKDPQVMYGFGPTQGSLYDCLEDKDTDRCLEECLVVARVGHTPAVVRNSAFLFVKPHAATAATIDLVRSHLIAKGCEIAGEGRIDAGTIDANMLIDKHYYAIASKATLLSPEELPVPKEKFAKAFGTEWPDALATGKVLNAKQACERLQLDAAGLGALWMEAKKTGSFVKLGGGFYCAKIDVASEAEGRASYFVFNGFFMEMRNKYVAPGASIHYFQTEFDPLDLSWAAFRGEVLGPTDPSTASPESLRGQIYAKWQDLGLQHQPDIADNAVHASASPFEALSERMNWLGVQAEDDAFGQLLLHGGVTMEHIMHWALDPQVKYVSQKETVTCSLYDALEDLDADRCVTQSQLIVGDEAPSPQALTGVAAETLQKEGQVLQTSHFEGYDVYSFKYVVEDTASQLWEVSRDLMKVDGRYAEEAVWSARKLNDAETQHALSLPRSQTARSPLTNRAP